MDVNLSKLREIVKDRGAWRATIYGDAKSQMWLSDWTMAIIIEQRMQDMVIFVCWFCGLSFWTQLPDSEKAVLLGTLVFTASWWFWKKCSPGSLGVPVALPPHPPHHSPFLLSTWSDPPRSSFSMTLLLVWAAPSVNSCDFRTSAGSFCTTGSSSMQSYPQPLMQ